MAVRVRGGLAGRLFLAEGLVVVAALLAAALVASVVGPPIFHDHLMQAGHTMGPSETSHIEAAYADASAISLAVALVVAVAFSLAVAWYVTRRIQAPLAALATAARDVEAGHVPDPVPHGGIGPELDEVADAFNTMAARLAQTDETRRRLLSDLAHELRTPVATITAYVDGLRDGVATWDDDVAQVISEQSARLTRLAADIREVSLAQEGALPLVLGDHPLGPLVTTAVEGAREAYRGKGVDLRIETSAAPDVLVRVDPERIAQVLVNLLGNALRHTDPGGHVAVDLTRAGTDAVLTVSDSGEGMTRDQVAHVFERFYRGDTARDRDRGGSGIGLTVSRALVDQHGGSLVAESPGPGQGSTFTVRLPALRG